ncbi:hypothetical protein B4N84_00080 [Flavobacterium sp. IR1]|jgi:hypothetical protein|uniref:IS66 family insertion sequence element accessory protein TnpA n=1 Tax=Alkalihalophilus marmarensis TaxID=521377 RepID=UPI000BA56AF4|nr:hypothetical protein [Alkalihalophilus marmarensis]MCM3491788.1 hypothetical protein [Alkalihalophilus marmarensis]PAM96844.1 hypothetical protein B4N84_00080 [Flavobacterium sp. IR1]
MNRKEKSDLWKSRMEDFEASGETIPEWVAKQEDITEYQFHYWRKKFKTETKSYSGNLENSGWTTLDVPTFTTRAAIEMRVDDVSLFVPEDVSEEHLCRVLRVLRNG